MLLRPGMTVLARSLSMRREIQAVLEGRNGCRPEQWLAVRTENGFQRVMPGVE